MSRSSIVQRIVYAHNPLPNVSEAELLKDAGLDMIEASRISPFTFRWNYGGEHIFLEAGENIPLRESEAALFRLEFEDHGGVVLEDAQDDAEVRRVSIEGLRRAQKRYKAGGAVLVLEYRKRHGITKEEAEERKHDLWAYHLCEAKANACEREIKRLSTPVPSSSAKSK